MKYRLSLSGEDCSGLGSLDLEGVGLIRGEFLLRDRLASLRIASAVSALQTYVGDVCAEFAGRPVWYRLVDLWSDEAAVLSGSPTEEREHNPILGSRGIRRCLADLELMRIELNLLSEVSANHSNLCLLVPFVQDASEFKSAVEQIRLARFEGRVGAMLEIPSALLDANSFVQAGASNLLIGMNDLSCLTLGRDRGSYELKLHTALWRLIDMVPQSLPPGFEWGVAGSLKSEIIHRAKRAGAGYVSVHYAEAASILKLDSGLFPQSNYVKSVKEKTAEAKRGLRRAD